MKLKHSSGTAAGTALPAPGRWIAAEPNDRARGEAFEEDELYSPGVLFNVKQAKYDKN